MRVRELLIALAIVIGFSSMASASPIPNREVGLQAALPTAEYAGYRYRRYGYYRPRRYRTYGYYRPRYYRPAYYSYRPRYYRPAYYGYRRPGIYIGF